MISRVMNSFLFANTLIGGIFLTSLLRADCVADRESGGLAASESTSNQYVTFGGRGRLIFVPNFWRYSESSQDDLTTMSIVSPNGIRVTLMQIDPAKSTITVKSLADSVATVQQARHFTLLRRISDRVFCVDGERESAIELDFASRNGETIANRFVVFYLDSNDSGLSIVIELPKNADEHNVGLADILKNSSLRND